MTHHKLSGFLIVLILVTSLLAAFFHCHDAGQDFGDCVVCKIVRQIVILFLGALAGLFISLSKRLFPAYRESFTSLLLPSKLRSRAPPLFQ
jgi:hypothetical protein